MDDKFSFFYKPNIFCSRCIEFDNCRYNGNIISSDTVKALKPHVEFTVLCPESDIGLGVPRDPIRIISDKGELKLIQPATGKDVSQDMISYGENSADMLEKLNIDGFILKSQSPSCAVSGAKVYPGNGRVRHVDSTPGFFGGMIRERFSDSIVEDEGRLRNFLIREHFYTVIFTLARFRNIASEKKPGDLVEFHSRAKYLLMSYNQDKMRKLGKIVAKSGRKDNQIDIFEEYFKGLKDIFGKMPRISNVINSLQHISGYFKKELNEEEKKYFGEMLEKLRNRKLPLSVPVSILRSWVIRFGDDYLRKQYIFSPFPEELIDIIDSGQGRSLR